MWDSSPGWEHRRPTGGWWCPDRRVLVWRILKSGSRSVQKWCLRAGMQAFDRTLDAPPLLTVAAVRDPQARYWAAVYQNHRGADLEGHLCDVLGHNRSTGRVWDADGDLHFLDQHRFWPAEVTPRIVQLEQPEAFLTVMREHGVDGGPMEHRSPAPDEWKALLDRHVTADDRALVESRYATDIAMWRDVT